MHKNIDKKQNRHMLFPTQMMRSAMVLVAISLLMIATALDAANRSSRKSVVNLVKGISADFDSNRVSLFINDLRGEDDPGVLVGDALKYTISSTEPNYLLLVLVDPKGNVSVIFPDYSVLDKPQKYASFQYPPAGTGTLEQAEPVGIETVIAFSSDIALTPRDLNFSPDFDLHTIGSDMQTIQDFVALLNEKYTTTNTSAFSYKYFVDSDVQFNTRAVRRELKKRVRQVEVIAISENQQMSSADRADATVSGDTVSSEGLSEALTVNDIRFETNSDLLSSVGRIQLDLFGGELINVFSENPNIVVTLDGHTDDRGDLDYNQSLSERRALAAKRYLIREFDLPEDGIRTRGLGETMPIASNASSESRALNRRVEIRLGRR